LRIFEQIGDNQRAGEVHFHLGNVLRFFGPQTDFHRALTHLQTAEALLRETREQRPLGMLQWGLSVIYVQQLRSSEALAASQKAMDIFSRLGDRESWARVAGNHGQYLMVKGKLAQATALVDEVARAATGFVNPDVFGEVSWLCGLFWFMMKAQKHAMRYFRQGLQRPGQNMRVQAQSLTYLALCEAQVGNLTEAKRLVAENFVLPVFRTLIAHYDGNWKAAGEALEEAFDRVQRVSAKWEVLATLMHSIDVRRVTGDYLGAETALESALRLYQPDDLYWEALIRPSRLSKKGSE
jgi:tetratricopeptide (TPR) repeat protein